MEMEMIRAFRDPAMPYMKAPVRMLIKCSKCGVEKEDTEFYWKIRGIRRRADCKRCCLAVQKKYFETEAAKAVRKKYVGTEEGKAVKKKGAKKYIRSAKGKVAAKKHARTAKGKASKARADSNRRDKERDEINTLTKKQWLEILEGQEHKCNGCKEPFTEEKLATEDHIIPIGDGPGRTKENMQALCRVCNTIKGVYSMEYLLKSLADLK